MSDVGLVHVLGIDPGGTSGWARAATDTPILLKRTLQWGELSPAQTAEKLRAFCLEARRVQGGSMGIRYKLVMERFTITAQTGKLSPQPDALELIGLGRYLAEWSGVEFDVSQQPADAKSFATNEQLRAWGVWVPKLEHARDAVRHLCLYAAKQAVYL